MCLLCTPPGAVEPLPPALTDGLSDDVLSLTGLGLVNRWNIMDAPGTPIVLTYNFPQVLPDYLTGEVPGFQPFDAAQAAHAEAALALWEDAGGVTFVRVPDTVQAEITFHFRDMSDRPGTSNGFARYPADGTWNGMVYHRPGEIGGDIFINVATRSGPGELAPGQLGFGTLIHEIGHAVGLGHPFSGDVILDPAKDVGTQTIMSYNRQADQQTLGALDPLALQALYGPDVAATAHWDAAAGHLVVAARPGGDTLFGQAPPTLYQGGAGDDTVLNPRGGDTVEGGAGQDHATVATWYVSGDAVLTGTELVLTLEDGGLVTFRDVETFTFANGTFALADFTTPLVLNGTTADEVLTGDAGADTIRGNGGADTIAGQGGADYIVAGSGPDRILGGAGGDTVLANSGDDTVQGGDGADSLRGWYGDDHLRGDGGADTLLGQIGSDTLEGGLGDDRLEGAEGSDELRGGLGDDTLEGGDDFDQLWGDGGADLLSGGGSADFLRGGRGEDTLVGGAGDDALSGQKNGDSLKGGAGDDTLRGGAGDDRLEGGTGDDYLNGGTRADVMLGGAGDDRLFGRSFADLLEGGDGRDTLNAGGGADTLNGGRGQDLMKGGDGADRFVFDLGHAFDRIADFDVSEDTLVLSAALHGGRSAATLVSAAHVTATGVYLVLNGTDSILLEGVSDTAALTAALELG